VLIAAVAIGFAPVKICIAAESPWRIETADPAGGGRYSSMRIDREGNLHVAYVDEATYTLHYGFRDAKLNKWFTTVIDRSSGFSSLALDSQQRPHISYIDYGHAQLKYAHWRDGVWEKQAVQIRAKDISYYTSIALPNDLPCITYYEYWGSGEDYRLNLRNVWLKSDHWELRTIDTDPGSGKFNALALDSTGNPHAAYGNVKSENASVRYARWDGQTWKKNVIEGLGISGYVAWSVQLAMGPGDVPHITFTDAGNRLIKYATIQNGQWRVEVIARVASAAYPDRNGIAVDDVGKVYISYYDSGVGTLNMAYRSAGRWISEVVDSDLAGFTSSLQLASGGIWITYADEHGALKAAWRSGLPALRATTSVAGNSQTK
jgi:hypothetical protein